MQTTVQELKWGDNPKIRTALEAVRPRGAVSTPIPQREIGQMLVDGLDVILQNRMCKRRL